MKVLRKRLDTYYDGYGMGVGPRCTQSACSYPSAYSNTATHRGHPALWYLKETTMRETSTSAQSNQGDDVDTVADTLSEKLDTVLANQDLIMEQQAEIIEKLTNLSLDRDY